MTDWLKPGGVGTMRIVKSGPVISPDGGVALAFETDDGYQFALVVDRDALHTMRLGLAQCEVVLNKMGS